MASLAQISANQLNAQRSTGPRTPEGKAASARNRTAHGLSSREFVILPGQEAEFEEFMTGLSSDMQPHGHLEHDLFTQFAHAAWNLRRCRIAERDLMESSTAGLDPILDAGVTDRLRLIDLYIRRSERTCHRLLRELKVLQNSRQVLTDLHCASRRPSPNDQPAPLADNFALASFRNRLAKVSEGGIRSRMDSLVRDPSKSTKDILAALRQPSSNSAPPFEQSNPIPAAAATTAG